MTSENTKAKPKRLTEIPHHTIHESADNITEEVEEETKEKDVY